MSIDVEGWVLHAAAEVPVPATALLATLATISSIARKDLTADGTGNLDG